MSDLHRPFLVGKSLYLRGLEKSDLEGNWLQWFNDKQVTKYMYNGTYPSTYEGHFEFYQSVCVNNKNHLVLAIIDKADDKHVGNLGLHQINWLYRRAEIGIVVGERSAWGKGLGTEATKLIIDHGFRRLNLHKIIARTESENKGAIRMFERAGFQVEAELKDEIMRDGRFFPVTYLGAFAKDCLR